MKLITLALLATAALSAAQTVGERPYEMVWANRTQDDHPAFIDFEDTTPWKVECQDAVAKTEFTREQQIFGQYVLKLTYRRNGNVPVVTIRPPRPLPIPADIDAAGLWCYGNNWAWVPDPLTPQVTICLLFKTPDGKEQALRMATVNWREWFLMVKRMPDALIEAINLPGTLFTGIQIIGGRNLDDRVLYFDSLTLFKEEFKPLTFAPRAQRGIPLFPGQDPGVNTLKDKKLPFPNTLDTILPSSAVAGSTNDVTKQGAATVFTYTGPDGKLTITYMPQSGSWSDITASWNGGTPFYPLKDGGARFPSDPNAPQRGNKPEATKLINTSLENGKLSATWHLLYKDDSFYVTYTFSLRGKTLVVDTVARGGRLGVVSYGDIVGLTSPQTIRIPYYDYANGRPALVLAQTDGKPLFVSAHTDWYLSNSSLPYGAPNAADGKAWANGGVEYIPKTDGKRNDAYERFFITIGPRVEEHFPNIPNPKSPWKHITGTVLWRAHGASNRDYDKAYWYNIWRHGMRHCLITDHEVCWRDSGESFTFRTRPAPKKGGDAGWIDYSNYMQKTLGFVYGPYNNFTDFAPVNEYWSTDMVARHANNQFMGAWARCYAPKPLRAVEFCEKLSPINQAKFHFSTAYCDVHTSVTPWGRCDYDYRVPGAGTFGQVFYAFGEIMLLQKAAWNGPVYSEGPHFCYYSGLTDGNYAQDRSYNIASQPWFVDFDLLKIHPQENNFGMGNEGMFYTNDQMKAAGGKTEGLVDRFLAATIAFGHPGFLVAHGGMRNTLRGYYLLQQIQSQYTQCDVKSIRYCDANGNQFTTTDALVNGAYKRSQLVITYNDGTVVVVNGNMTESMAVTVENERIVLPPNGFQAWNKGAGVSTFSALQKNQRCDYAVSPDYIYMDGRDKAFQQFPLADGVGCAIARKDDATHWEIIPFKNADCGFAIEGGDAHAFDHKGNDLGPAKLRRCRGLLYVEPVKDAFSYKIDTTKTTPESRLASADYSVPNGATVTIQTPDGPVKRVIEGKINERIWVTIQNESICFVIREIFSLQPRLEGQAFVCTFTNLADKEIKATVKLSDGQTADIVTAARGEQTIAFPIPKPTQECLQPLSMEITADSASQIWQGGLISKLEPVLIPHDFLKDFATGCHVLGEDKPRNDIGTVGARCEVTTRSCGEVSRRGFFMHPPWLNRTTGRTFSLHKVKLPNLPDLMFSALVGKCDGSDLGDGIYYYVVVIEEGWGETVIAQQHVPVHIWKPITGDLSRWAGKTVTIKLVTDVGPTGNSSGDWAFWADIHVQRKEKQYNLYLDSIGERYATATLPSFIPNLTQEQLRSATKATLCYKGQGLDSSSRSGYAVKVLLNNQDGGILLPAGGDENKNIWSDVIRLDLPKDVIQSLTTSSTLILTNTSDDCFKIRDFYLELTLADGRTATSRVATAVFSQNASWRYAEGIRLDWKAPIVIPIFF